VDYNIGTFLQEKVNQLRVNGLLKLQEYYINPAKTGRGIPRNIKKGNRTRNKNLEYGN